MRWFAFGSELELPDLANQTTGHSIKLELQLNHDQFFSINMCSILHGTCLYQKNMAHVIFLKFTYLFDCARASCNMQDLQSSLQHVNS